MITLVLLPGLDGSAELFSPFIDALGPGLQAQPMAYPASEPLGYAGLEALVRAALPTSGPFMVLGESFSGPIAVALAASPPPGLLGVVLCCSFAHNPHPWLAFMRPALRFMPFKKLAQGACGFVLTRLLLGKQASPQWRKALACALGKSSSAVLRARLVAVLDLAYDKRMAAARVPVLYLRATEDRIVPKRASKRIASALPTARILSLPGPHFLLQASPQAAAQAVYEFSQTLEPRE